MTAEDFRRIALGMRDAIESAHMGHPDLRINGQIFATLQAGEKWGMVKLTPDQQHEFAQRNPGAFVPEKGAWGRQGCTAVRLNSIDEETLGEAMTLAWRNSAAKRVLSGSKDVRTNQKPLWTCPKCRHRFVTRNLWHSCGRYPLSSHFRGRSKVVRKLFDRWRALAKACGPVTVYAQKTRIVFQSRVRFAGAVVHHDWLDASIWLPHPVDHQRVLRIESFGRLGYGVHFRLTKLTDIDGRLGALMREAYAVHAKAHRRDHQNRAM